MALVMGYLGREGGRGRGEVVRAMHLRADSVFSLRLVLVSDLSPVPLFQSSLFTSLAPTPLTSPLIPLVLSRGEVVRAMYL